jgi:hypothetical protein
MAIGNPTTYKPASYFMNPRGSVQVGSWMDGWMDGWMDEYVQVKVRQQTDCQHVDLNGQLVRNSIQLDQVESK